MRVRLVDNPRAEVGEHVHVGVGVRVGVVECQLKGRLRCHCRQTTVRRSPSLIAVFKQFLKNYLFIQSFY